MAFVNGCFLLTGAGQHPLSQHVPFKLVSEIKKNSNTLMMCDTIKKKKKINNV